MKISKAIQKSYSFIKAIDGVFGLVAGLCILVITAVVSYEVFFRYVLNRPPSWAFDVCSYLLLAVAVFSGVYAMEQDGHVRFTMLVQKLKPKPRIIIISMGSIFGIIYCVVLLTESIKLGLLAIERNIYTFAQARIPEIYLYLIIITGAFFLSLTFLVKLVLEIYCTPKKD